MAGFGHSDDGDSLGTSVERRIAVFWPDSDILTTVTALEHRLNVVRLEGSDLAENGHSGDAEGFSASAKLRFSIGPSSGSHFSSIWQASGLNCRRFLLFPDYLCNIEEKSDAQSLHAHPISSI